MEDVSLLSGCKGELVICHFDDCFKSFRCFFWPPHLRERGYTSVCETAWMASSGRRDGSLRMDVFVLSLRRVLSTTKKTKQETAF